EIRLDEEGPGCLSRVHERSGRIGFAVGGEPVLIVRLIPARFETNGELGPRQAPRERARGAESGAVIHFFGLAAASLEAAARGRDREEELPVALRRVHGGAPEQRPGEPAQTDPLLRAILPSAIGRVGYDVVIARGEFVLAQKAGRFPVGSVQLDAAVDAPYRRQVVHDAQVSLLDVGATVRSPAIFVVPSRAEHAAAFRAVVESR